MGTAAPQIRIGCQGWRYADWRVIQPMGDGLAAPFYPKSILAAQELHAYSQTFDLVEVDATFYAIPSAQTLQQWAVATPAEFRFTLKLPRSLTHDARLKRGRATLLEFCGRAELLADKLAAILIQLPPSFGIADYPTLEKFLPHLPKTLPFAIEFRDRSWLTERTVALLSQYQVALVLGETPWLPTTVCLPWLKQLPTDWLYVRIMGTKEGGLERFTHLQVNRDLELDTWVAALQTLDKSVYVLVDNHFQGFSPATATLLKRKLGQNERPFPRDCVTAQLELW